MNAGESNWDDKSHADPRISLAAWESAPVGLCALDADRTIIACNERFLSFTDLRRNAIIGTQLGQILAGADAVLDDLSPSSDGISEARLPYSRPHGTRIIRLSAALVENGYSVCISDVTQPSTERQTLMRAIERSNFALESAGQWIWDYDLLANRVWRSQQWKPALGFSSEEVSDESEPWSIVHPADRKVVQSAMQPILSGTGNSFEATYRIRHKDGSWRHILSRGKVVEFTPDGRPSRVLATSVDITRQKEIEQELQATIRQRKALEHDLLLANRRLRLLAEVDSLTELPNRRKFDKALEREFRRARRTRPVVSLLMIDIDYFKGFNDMYGHIAGDECLKAVAEALQRVVRRERDLVTRYGGEEFAAILGDTEEAEAIAIAQRMAEEVRHLAISHTGSPFGQVTICIGLTTFCLERKPWSSAPQQLIRDSDAALYAAKEAGRNAIVCARRLPDGGDEMQIIEMNVAPAAGDLNIAQ